MKKLSDKPPNRLQLLMTDEELADVKSYQHQQELYGRSEALRRLIKIGLDTEETADNWRRPND